ncbi:MAG: GtrA family protein [Patescibacteria group bacterium]
MTDTKKVFTKDSLFRQVILFFGVGVINTAIDFFILNVLTYSTQIHQGIWFSVFKAISFSAATANSYIMNSRFTFSVEKERAVKDVPAFLLASMVGLLLNVSVASVIVHYCNALLPEMSGQLVINIGGLAGTATSLVWNFVSYKYLVFKKK